MHVGADGYIDKTPEEAGNLCGLFKFRGDGYRNIELLAFLLTIFLVPLPSWVLSRRVKTTTKSSDPEQSDATSGQSVQTSDTVHDQDSASRGYGTMEVTGCQASGPNINQNRPEISPASPTNTVKSGSPEKKGKEVQSTRGGSQGQGGDNDSSISDLIVIPGQRSDARHSSRSSTGNEERGGL